MERYLQPRINCQPKSTVYLGHCAELPRPGGPEWFTLYNMILPSSSFTTAQTVQKEPRGLALHMLQMTEKHLCVLQQNPSRFYMPEHVLVGSSCKIGSYWFLILLYMGEKRQNYIGVVSIMTKYMETKQQDTLKYYKIHFIALWPYIFTHNVW